MAALEIPCPNCGSVLRLPDRSLLGRKGKCGKCRHKFILEEPEVNLELASDSEESINRTIMGVAAQLVPAEAPPRVVTSPAPRQVQARTAEAAYTRPPEPVPAPPPAIVIPGAEAEIGGVARMKALQRKNAKNRNIMLGLGGFVVAACALAYFLVGAPPERPRKARKPKPSTTEVASTQAHASGASTGPKGPVESPTEGKPIELLLVPPGSRLVVHMRPAELWEAGGVAEEFRACLGPLVTWLEGVIKTKCLTDPAAIEEAMFCVIPAEKGTPPDVAVVVRTKSEFKKSDLLEKFNGEMRNELGRPYYVGDQNAYVILDERTYAISPASMAEDMVQAADGPSVTAEGIEAVLTKTDRSRHFTLEFEPVAVRIDAPFLAPANAQRLLNACLNWFGDDVEAAGISFHLGESFFSEILLRNQLVMSPPKLQKVFEEDLQTTPRDMVAVVKKSHPQKIGEKKIIGRFPAMTKAFAMATHITTGNRLVTLRTDLPDRAGPNLALASLLTWDQTTRPDYGGEAAPSAAPSSKAKLPDTFAERLQKKINVDFRDDFLYAALAFIEEETATKIKLDGNSLKMIGVTQNEKVKFQMDDTPAISALEKILTKRNLVIVVDEEKKMITVMSAVAAKERGLEPFPFTPKGG